MKTVIWGGKSSVLRLKILFSIEQFHPIALKKAKIVYNFGLSECNRVKEIQ